jgi:hypothetical protein
VTNENQILLLGTKIVLAVSATVNTCTADSRKIPLKKPP